jgi:hypothetical protein
MAIFVPDPAELVISGAWTSGGTAAIDNDRTTKTSVGATVSQGGTAFTAILKVGWSSVSGTAPFVIRAFGHINTLTAEPAAADRSGFVNGQLNVGTLCQPTLASPSQAWNTTVGQNLDRDFTMSLGEQNTFNPIDEDCVISPLSAAGLNIGSFTITLKINSPTEPGNSTALLDIYEIWAEDSSGNISDVVFTIL